MVVMVVGGGGGEYKRHKISIADGCLMYFWHPDWWGREPFRNFCLSWKNRTMNFCAHGARDGRDTILWAILGDGSMRAPKASSNWPRRLGSVGGWTRWSQSHWTQVWPMQSQAPCCYPKSPHTSHVDADTSTFLWSKDVIRISEQYSWREKNGIYLNWRGKMWVNLDIVLYELGGSQWLAPWHPPHQPNTMSTDLTLLSLL